MLQANRPWQWIAIGLMFIAVAIPIVATQLLPPEADWSRTVCPVCVPFWLIATVIFGIDRAVHGEED